jgi:hypothetical protein
MCPVSTEGGTRRVQLVREGGGGGGAHPRNPRNPSGCESRTARCAQVHSMTLDTARLAARRSYPGGSWRPRAPGAAICRLAAPLATLVPARHPPAQLGSTAQAALRAHGCPQSHTRSSLKPRAAQTMKPEESPPSSSVTCGQLRRIALMRPGESGASPSVPNWISRLACTPSWSCCCCCCCCCCWWWW